MPPIEGGFLVSSSDACSLLILMLSYVSCRLTFTLFLCRFNGSVEYAGGHEGGDEHSCCSRGGGGTTLW
jgi:hypothetical protein